jgi:hypothetical protein
MKTSITAEHDPHHASRSAAVRDLHQAPGSGWGQALNSTPRQQQQAAQLKALQRVGPDEEEPLQGKLLQRASPEEELPVQGKLLQRAAPEEELPMQGKLLQRAAPEEELPMQGKLLQRAGPEEELPMQGRADPAARGGLPAQLRAGIEALSGVDMSGVRVHANSDRPAQVNALAFAQGQDIHLAPGQEHHLPHEAWHVAQQAQGRVQPTVQMAGAAINDDPALEAEADAMGARALQQGQQIS